METIKIQHLFGRFFIFFLLLIVVVFAEEYSINRLCLNINGFPFIFMNAFMIVGIAYIYQKATRKLFIKEFEYEIYEDFFYINGNKYEYQDVINFKTERERIRSSGYDEYFEIGDFIVFKLYFI